MKWRILNDTRQCGISLLEVLLVVALAALLIMIGLRFYVQFRFQQQIAVVNQSIVILSRAMSDYYYLNCSAGELPLHLNITDLTAAGVLDTSMASLVNNPFGQGFQLVFNLQAAAPQSQQQRYTIVITAVFDKVGNQSITGLAQLLAADPIVSGDMLTWTSRPGARQPDTDNSFWILHSYLQYFGNNPTSATVPGQGIGVPACIG